jgi:hypothetical protein
LPDLGEKVGTVGGDDEDEGLYTAGHFEHMQTWRTKTMRPKILAVSTTRTTRDGFYSRPSEESLELVFLSARLKV